MAKGRKVGQIELSMDEILIIIRMTLTGNYTRRQIAKEINRCRDTVYRYQKAFGLV